MRPAAPVPHLTHPKLLRRARSPLGRAIEAIAAAATRPFLFVAALAVLFASTAASMTGVHVHTGATSGTGDVLRAPGSRYFIAGCAEKGDDATPVVCKTFPAFVREFGNAVAYGFLYRDALTYFKQGGTELVVTRVVGDAATKGELQLVDRALAPVNTVKLTAFSAGAWSTDLTATVDDGEVDDTVTIVLTYKAGTVDEIVETFRNLASPAAIVTKINASSRLAVASNDDSATVAPGNLPAVMVATAFSAGDDDIDSVDADALVAALDRFTFRYGPGAVAIPGYDASLVADGLEAHCAADDIDRIGLTHDEQSSSVEAGKTLALSLRGATDSEYVGIFGPWVSCPDGAGGVVTVPPTGSVAARRAAAHQSKGPWLWPAGEAGKLTFVTGAEFDMTAADIDDLIGAGFNPIVAIDGQGLEVYGWRSLSVDEAYYSLATRDTLNVHGWQAKRVLQPLVFKPIDGKGVTVADARGRLVALCEDMKQAGGLYPLLDDTGAELDPGYSVTVEAVPAERKLSATTGLRIVEAAELIEDTITAVGPDQTV